MTSTPHQIQGDVNFLIDLSTIEQHFHHQVNTLFSFRHTTHHQSEIEIAQDLFHIALQYIETAYAFDVEPIYCDQYHQFCINSQAKEKVQDIYHDDLMEYFVESEYIEILEQSNSLVSLNCWIYMITHLLFQILLTIYNHLNAIIHQHLDQFVLVGDSMLPFHQQIQLIRVQRVSNHMQGDAIVEVLFHRH